MLESSPTAFQVFINKEVGLKPGTPLWESGGLTAVLCACSRTCHLLIFPLLTVIVLTSGGFFPPHIYVSAYNVGSITRVV